MKAPGRFVHAARGLLYKLCEAIGVRAVAAGSGGFVDLALGARFFRPGIALTLGSVQSPNETTNGDPGPELSDVGPTDAEAIEALILSRLDALEDELVARGVLPSAWREAGP